MKRSVACVSLLLAAPAIAFTPLSSIPKQSSSLWRSACTSPSTPTTAISPLFHSGCSNEHEHNNNLHRKQSSLPSSQKKIQKQQLQPLVSWNRLNTLESAGLPDARTAGLGEKLKLSKLKKLTKLHNPKTYMVFAAFCLYRYSWCFKSPYYWFAVGFLIKWYRARYVFKIPVWDRQPNWNNVITSPDQEKDLKAFTCKTCGSTIFIAKTREFFFEGSTGIGGLGCFSCGAKGKDNFVMDRDRIVEDVADEDDYFDYERPLDFVSRAERRQVLNEAGGDEEKANQLLMERANASSDTLIDKPEKEPIDVVVEEEDQSDDGISSVEDEGSPDKIVDASIEEKDNGTPAPEQPKAASNSEDSPKPKKKKKKKKEPKKSKPPADDEDLDVLGLDDF